MSDIEGKMNVLVEEANANYNAKRYKDAARTFEHLISLAIKNEEPEAHRGLLEGICAVKCRCLYPHGVSSLSLQR